MTTPVFASDRHRAHDPEHEIESSALQPPFEHPGRAEAIRAALAADERFALTEPPATGTEAIEAVHPTEPHWYLGVIATHPERRGHGLGAALLTESLRAVDRSHQPAYLESSNPRNITLYERHGFEVTGRIDIDDGVSMTPMWRPGR